MTSVLVTGWPVLCSGMIFTLDWALNEVLPQDTTHLIQRPCYQRVSPRQDPAGNRTTPTQRPPDHRKETQTAVVWSCLPFIRSGQSHFARHSEKRKKKRQTEEEVGRNMREWTGLEFAKSHRAVKNREKWRKLVANSSMVPQRPSRLRDRWDGESMGSLNWFFYPLPTYTDDVL